MSTNKLSEDEILKSAAIMHAIEIDSNFKLYSYRIISPEQFASRTQELIKFFQQSKIKSNGQEIDPMQTSIPID